MDITLSADKDLIEKSRRYAKAQHTSYAKTVNISG